MVVCAVATCSMSGGRDKSVCMFAFPKDPKLRQAWIFKCWKENYNLTKHSRVCEKRFNDSDFVLSRAFSASIGYNMNFQLQLQPDAVPSIIPRTKT